ncbi:Oidioi.mRNA.OKI2018_I69.chr2.g4351.t1.cds [Oikopleura dioica]|uniref:Oidioi.mRNA.OKI2018_I69.chr2.g4351.t1.cds n=1 Tax=Oikopleura dioica TaxID=34765 RepID=A0ABN7T1C4_OIKDI|nr:Oidioi.mRNA.OKI2018_I69.chr2.g4351.t1.cds [Oikopleura dioica]
MVESKKKKRAPPPKPTVTQDGSRDSGVGNSPKGTTQPEKTKKKRAPLPAPVKARQLSNSGQAVAMPITDIKTIQSGKSKLVSTQKQQKESSLSSIEGDDFGASQFAGNSKNLSRKWIKKKLEENFSSLKVFDQKNGHEIIKVLSYHLEIPYIEEDPKFPEKQVKQANADSSEKQKQQTNPGEFEEETNFDDLFGSDSEFTETEDFSERSEEKEADTGYFEGSTKSDCDGKSDSMEKVEKETVKMISAAEQKVEARPPIQQERKTSFTIVPGKGQLEKLQSQSIYATVNRAKIMEQTSSQKGHAAILNELSALKDQIAALKNKNSKAQVPYTVVKAVHKFRNEHERPVPSQKPPIAAKPKSRTGSASLQLDEQGNIVRPGSVSSQPESSKSSSPVTVAPKPVTTMPLDQNGNIRIVNKPRTNSTTFEIPKLKQVYSSQQYQQIPQSNQERFITTDMKHQSPQPAQPQFPQHINPGPGYPQMDPRMSFQYIPQYQPLPQQFQPSQSMDAQQYQQYIQQHQHMMQYHQQQQQAQAAQAYGTYHPHQQAPQQFQNHMAPQSNQPQAQKFHPIAAQQNYNPSRGAAPIDSVYGPSRSISESGSLARGQINANQNNSRMMKTSVNSSMSSPSPSMSSEEGAAQDNKTNAAFPFGKKLSLKKPQQRELVVTQTPREQLLSEVQSIAQARGDTTSSIPAGFVRQLSTSNDAQNSNSISTMNSSPPPVMLKPVSERKLKEKKEELTTHEELMRQIQRSRSVADQYIADGTIKATNGAPPPPPPAPVLAPQLKKVNVKQLPKVEQLTPQEALLSEIRSRGNKSQDYVYDGTNTERVNPDQPPPPPAPVLNLKPVSNTTSRSQKPLPPKEEDPRDFLLSQIRAGFTLKPVQN